MSIQNIFRAYSTAQRSTEQRPKWLTSNALKCRSNFLFVVLIVVISDDQMLGYQIVLFFHTQTLENIKSIFCCLFVFRLLSLVMVTFIGCNAILDGIICMESGKTKTQKQTNSMLIRMCLYSWAWLVMISLANVPKSFIENVACHFYNWIY